MINKRLTRNDLKKNYTKIICVGNQACYERLFKGEFHKVGHGERAEGWAYDCFQVNNQSCICVGYAVPFRSGYGISREDNENVKEYISYFEKFVQKKSWLDYKSYEHYKKAVARAKRKCIKGIIDVLEC